MLTQRVFDSKILKNSRMVELIEYVQHQGWLHNAEGPIPSVYEDKARQFFYIVKFFKDRESLTAMVQGNKINLDEETLGKILDVAIVVVRTISEKNIPHLSVWLILSKWEELLLLV